MEMKVNGVYRKKKNPIMNESKIQMKKVMVTIVWSVNGIYIVDFLPVGDSYNSEYFVEHIINKLYEMKADIWAESDVKKKLVTS
jgi:ATP-dependent Clp protease adapter protein ClpS